MIELVWKPSSVVFAVPNQCVFWILIETFRFEDNYEYEIWLEVFACILKI